MTKFMNTQFRVYEYVGYTPLKEIPPFWHAWSFFGRSYVYGIFLGVAEFLAGALILFPRVRLVGLLLATGIYINIILIDIEFQVRDALLHASVEFALVLILLIPYLPDLKKFFWDMQGRFLKYSGSSVKSLIGPSMFLMTVSLGAALFLNYLVLSPNNSLQGVYRLSGLEIQGKAIILEPGKHTKDPMLFFEFGNTCILSTDDNAFYGNYIFQNDTLQINLKQPFKNISSIKGKYNHEDGLLKGMTNDALPVQIKLERLLPDN